MVSEWLLVAAVVVCTAPWVWIAWSDRQAFARERAGWMLERNELMDRIQSPDLVAYYGARQAWHPDEFPQGPTPEYLRDEFGYVAEEAERPVDDGRLPGELPADA